jgi:hypothetical protein
MKGTHFAIPVDNITEVCAVDNHSTISTYDNNYYDCQFSFAHVVNLINDMLSSEINEVMTNANRHAWML